VIRQLFTEEGRRVNHELWVRMDLLERALPERVKEIQESSSDEQAYQLLAPLRNAVQECQKFTANQKRQLDLMLIGVTQFYCAESTPPGQLPGMDQQRIPKLKML
jgi:hypothetical protein